jgi:ion channel-forming bestrophin family protein
MHLGRKYKFIQFAGWTGWEAVYLILWSLAVTLFLQVSQWHFLTVPVPVLTIIGAALAIILGFKNQQCYARFNEALTLAGQVSTNSLILANGLMAALGRKPDAARDDPGLKEIFHRHFAWLTALRFFLREKKGWENTAARGNARFLARFPTPEGQSTLVDELKTYLPDSDIRRVVTYHGDKLSLILRQQYETISAMHRDGLYSEYIMITLTSTLDDLTRVEGALKRIKNYPYARNYYSIAVFLVAIFVAIVPFGLFPYAHELGESGAIGHWTVWLNVPFSAVVGWVFVSLEKVGENSSNPFEGGANDVPISAIARRIEIEMRDMLGEETDLKPIEAKDGILF